MIEELYYIEDDLYICIVLVVYIHHLYCLKQNYIKQYRSLQFNTNTLFSGYIAIMIDRVCQKYVPYKTLNRGGYRI